MAEAKRAVVRFKIGVDDGSALTSMQVMSGELTVLDPGPSTVLREGDSYVFPIKQQKVTYTPPLAFPCYPVCAPDGVQVGDLLHQSCKACGHSGYAHSVPGFCAFCQCLDMVRHTLSVSLKS